MTTVNENFPSTTGTYNYGGYVFTCKNGIERSRYSSGGNRPKQAYVKKFWSFTDSKVLLRTRAGKTTQTVVYKKKLRSYRVLNTSSPAFSEPHPYTRSSYKAIYGPYLATWSGGGSWNNPNVVWKFSTTASWGANEDIVLLNKLRGQLAGADFDVGVFLAELPEACSMIRNAATRIAKAYTSYKRGKAIDAWNHLTGSKPYKKLGITQSSNWLELQYGWLPLLQDAHNGAEFLAHNLSDVPRPKKYRVSHTVNSVGTVSTSPGSEGFGRNTHFIRKSIIAIVTENKLESLTGMIDPATVLWEKLPYSFVIDWFIPIGNYLSARGLASNVSGTFITSTLEKKQGRSFRRLSQPNGGTQYSGGVLDVEIVNFSRTISSSLSVKMPEVKPLAKIASWSHAANAVALLTQKFRS